MSNREQRQVVEYVHVLMGLSRPSQGEQSRCVRTVDKGRGDELEILEAKLKLMGGYWRIHKTVNARDCQKAMKILMKTLIDHPEKASYIDSEWRTALLQKGCTYEKKMFMLDVDSLVQIELDAVFGRIIESKGNVTRSIRSPKGWHLITEPFDTREVCKLDYVTLLRDGYYFVKEVGELTPQDKEKGD